MDFENPNNQQEFAYNELPETPVDAPKKKKGLLWGLLIAAFLVILAGVVFVTGYFTDWFGLVTPMDKLMAAFQNTFEAQNMTLEIEVKYDRVSADVDLQYMIDMEKEELTILMEAPGTSFLLYDDEWYRKYESYASKEDADTDEFFDTYEDIRDKDGKVDWEEVVDQLELDDVVDGENLGKFFEILKEECLSDKEWVEKYLEMKVEKNVYTFTPDMKALYDELLEKIEDEDVLDDEVLDLLEENEDQIKDVLKELDLKLIITLEGKYISSIEIELEINGEDASLEIKFQDINNTEITEDEIDDFIDDVEKLIKKDKCPDCGEPRYGSDSCYNCREYCYGCYSYYPEDEIYWLDGYSYCEDCYYNYFW